RSHGAEPSKDRVLARSGPVDVAVAALIACRASMRRPTGKIMPTTRPGGLSSPVLRILGIAAACSCATVSLDAHAYQPGMGGGMSPPPSPGQKKEKKEGPAEEAPEDKEALRPIEVVPAQPARLRRVQWFELDGYLRVRSDYFHR